MKGIVAIIFIILQCLQSIECSTACETLLGQLANEHSKFTYCVVENSAPVYICRKCVDQFVKVSEAYKNLMNGVNKDQVKCKDIYIGRDRLNTVEYTQQNLCSLWNRGSCSQCFEKKNEQFVIATEIQKLFDLLGNVTDCIKRDEKSACIRCHDMYVQTNVQFDKYMKDHDNQICFDVHDLMNRTQSHWSKDLKCCHRTRDLTLFLIISSVLTGIPLIFYLGFFCHTRRQERNHDMLHSDNVLNEERAVPTTVASSSSHQTTQASRPLDEESSSPRNNKSNYKTLEDSSDDEGESLAKPINKFDLRQSKLNNPGESLLDLPNP